MRVGKKLGLSAVLLLVGSGFGLNRASAEWVNLTLNTVSPGGTISISGTSGYGDGILAWTLNSDNSGTYTGQSPNGLGTTLSGNTGANGVSTYCIDTSHDVNEGSNYSFNLVTGTASQILTALQANANPPAYTLTQIQNIVNLYVVEGLTPSPSLTYLNQGNDANANFDAAAFQAALWDLIGAGGTLSNATYSSGTDTDAATMAQLSAAGITPTGNAVLDTAALWAYNAQQAGQTKYDNDGFTALVGAQNQAIYFQGPIPNDSNPVPLPPVAGTGMMLLAGVGVFYFGRRRLARVA